MGTYNYWSVTWEGQLYIKVHISESLRKTYAPLLLFLVIEMIIFLAGNEVRIEFLGTSRLRSG